MEPIGTFEGLVDGPGGNRWPVPALFRDHVSAECKDGVEAVEADSEEDRFSRVPSRVHRFDNQLHDVRADMGSVLVIGKGVVEANPFGQAGVGSGMPHS